MEVAFILLALAGFGLAISLSLREERRHLEEMAELQSLVASCGRPRPRR